MPQELPPPTGEIILYSTEDGRARVECRFAGETVWLTQALVAELYQKDVRTINEHLQNLFEEGELDPEATIRKFRIVRQEGTREVTRLIDYYNLEAILAVGYRVRSPRGVQFRRWATTRLSEYLVKGFTMDDERLKNPPSTIVESCLTRAGSARKTPTPGLAPSTRSLPPASGPTSKLRPRAQPSGPWRSKPSRSRHG